MALVLQVGLQNALADAITTYVDAGTAPELVFENGTDTAVATIILNATSAFGTAATGVITMAGQPLSDTNADGGTAAQFSIYQNVSQGATKCLEGTVATAAADINISSVAIGASDTVTLTTFTITVPDGT